MEKSAIIPINYHNIQSPINFKKQALLFDKIIIEEQSLALARTFVGFTSSQQAMNLENYNNNNQTIDFLGNEGLLKFETINNTITINIGSEEDKFMQSLVSESIDINRLLADLKASPTGETLIKLMTILKKLPSAFARALSIRLKSAGSDAYPIFDDDLIYGTFGQKEEVLKFILTKIPEPEDSISWEQLLDFRKDPDTINKYYALIKWVNDVSKKGFTLNEIDDEYQSLYSDYVRQYSLHKIKSKQGTLEIIVTAALDVLTQNLGVGRIITSLFSLWKHNLILLEAEAKFIGREIAYIHKAQQKFN